MIVSSRFFATAAAVVSALAFLVSAAEEGECVCYEGYIMDRFCINRGALLDPNGVPTLENPAVHTMHCLWDVPMCINSGYTVLADPEMAGERFTVAAQFDSNGDALVTEFGVARGDPGPCSQCTGELGQQTEGFRATIVGRVAMVGNPDSSDPLEQAPSLEVLEVKDSSVGCADFSCPAPAPKVGDCVCHEGFIMDRFCINRGALLDPNGVPTLENPAVHTMHCLWDVPMCINSGYTVLAEPEMMGERFTVAYQFDANGDALVTELGVASGDPGPCSQCTGELGQQTEGFRATIIGRIETLGNAESDDPLEQASTLAVTEVLESSVGCAAFTCPEVVEPDAPDEGGTTTTPDEDVDCNDFVSMVELSGNPVLSMDFTVNVPGTDTNKELSAEEVAAGGSMSVRLTYEGDGWVGLALSSNGRMVGSASQPHIAAICLPAVVSKYMLGAQAVSGVTEMPEASQTLIETSVTQEGGVTVCEFTKLLVEEGEIPIDPNGVNNFIWAVGSSNELAYHRSRGQVDIPLEPCTPSGVSEFNPVFGSSETFDSYWKAHGVMMALAWGFCAPVAIASALARSIIPGEGTWFKIHQTMNFLCCILTIAAFGVAVAAYNKAGTPHFDGTHQKVGLSIFIIVLFQVTNGALRPHLPQAAKTDPAKDEEEADANETPPPEEKSKKRTGWEVGHKLTGAALLGMGMYNGYSGPMLYAARGLVESTDGWLTAWWTWLGVLLGIAAGIKIMSVARK